jgi:hypothetical protein
MTASLAGVSMVWVLGIDSAIYVAFVADGTPQEHRDKFAKDDLAFYIARFFHCIPDCDIFNKV